MISSLGLGHDDFVHDVQFDFYGNQLATCSSDQKIKVWHKIYPENQTTFRWECKQTLAGGDGHTGAVWRVAWADPEFGDNAILASCGYDKNVIIWSETEANTKANRQQESGNKQWHKKHHNIEKDSVYDIKFAPKHLGLALAVAIANGSIKIYKCADPNNLTTFFNDVTEIIVVSSGECTCLDWNPAFDEPMSLVVGCYQNSVDDLHVNNSD